MKVMLLEGAPGLGADAGAQLLAAGCTVVSCDSDVAATPCRGLEEISRCPLDANDVDVAVVAHAGGELVAAERGALCAAQHRVPVVIAHNPGRPISFGPGTHVAGPDLVAACRAAAVSGDAHVAAVRRELLIGGVIDAADVQGPEPRVTFSVQRDRRRLRLAVTLPADDARRANITKAAAEALRRFDRQAAVIDVAVTTH